jgi:hypothetical protein
MAEKSDQQVALSGQAPSPRPSIDEQPGAKTGHQIAGETLEAAAIRGLPASALRSEGHMGHSLGQILIVLVVLLVLVNIPTNFYGAGLAQIMPKATAIVIRNGMLLKGSGPELYVLQDHVLRRINNPEAFDYYIHQHKVHLVEDNVLESFGRGRSIYRLVTCPNSSHIYALEQGQKRWVKDPPTRNQAEPWDEVRVVSCDYLRQLPEGSPILGDVGPPP